MSGKSGDKGGALQELRFRSDNLKSNCRNMRDATSTREALGQPIGDYQQRYGDLGA